MTTIATADQVLQFWLVDVGEKGWYDGNATLDATIRERFRPTWDRAAELAPAWAVTPRGALAALILTDQFPRNMYRNDPRAFATDPLARQIANAAIAAGFDQEIAPPARQFFYMPFEHSEHLADQKRCIDLFRENMPGESLQHAEMHHDTIAKFGRFPWRNDALGRPASAAENRVMQAGGYGALISGKLLLDDLA